MSIKLRLPSCSLLLLAGLLNINSSAQVWRDLNPEQPFGTNGLRCLEHYGDGLLIGGLIDLFEEYPSNGILLWDSVSFTPFGLMNGTVKAMAVSGDSVIATGFYQVYETDIEHFAMYKEGSWQELANETIPDGGGLAKAAAYFDGRFFLGGNNIPTIRAWDGYAWEMIGGPSGALYSTDVFAIYNGKLLAGGDFYQDDNGVPMYNLAEYQGDSTWTNFHGGVGGYLRDLFVDTNTNILYVAGLFSWVGLDFTPASRVAAWNGTVWKGFGNGWFNSDVYTICTYRDQLYASGNFDFIIQNGDTLYLNGFARFNGVEWEAVPGWISGGAFDMTVYKDELYVAGNFSYVGDSIPVNSVARYYLHPDSVVWGIPEQTPGTPLSVSEQEISPLLQLAPNPNHGSFTVHLGELPLHSTLEIRTMSGQLIREERISGHILKIEGLSSGTYLVHIIHAGTVLASERVVVR